MQTYKVALLLSIILPIFVLLQSIMHNPLPSHMDTDIKGYTIGHKAKVSAFIGNARYTITGYTSPFATVKLEGQGVYDETIADKNGRFIFNNGFSPLTPREVCITAIDIYKRITNPLCLAPFPIKKDIAIGPVILPPTLSINQPEYLINDYGILHGLSTPKSNVRISMATELNNQNINLTTDANEKGEYSITLPTTHKDTIHITSRSKLDRLESIASNFLTFHILPWWILMIQWMTRALRSLMGNIIPLVLFVECGLISYLIWGYLMGRSQKHPLALRPESFLELPEKKKELIQSRRNILP